MILFPFNRETLLQLLPKNAVICEIGVAEGNFSQKILDHTQPQKLHLIDPWIYQDRDDYTNDHNNTSDEEGELRSKAVHKRFKEQTDLGNIEIHRAFSYDVVDQFPDEYFDWIYVDAVHSYQGAKEDLERFLPKVKQDGLIIGHDYANHLYARQKGFGVVEAVDEFCLENDLDFFALTEGDYPTFILTRDEDNKTAQALRNTIYFNAAQITEIFEHPKHTKMQLEYFTIEGKVGVYRRFLPRD